MKVTTDLHIVPRSHSPLRLDGIVLNTALPLIILIDSHSHLSCYLPKYKPVFAVLEKSKPCLHEATAALLCSQSTVKFFRSLRGAEGYHVSRESVRIQSEAVKYLTTNVNKSP